jgi:hypothetical protein
MAACVHLLGVRGELARLSSEVASDGAGLEEDEVPVIEVGHLTDCDGSDQRQARAAEIWQISVVLSTTIPRPAIGLRMRQRKDAQGCLATQASDLMTENSVMLSTVTVKRMDVRSLSLTQLVQLTAHSRRLP